MKRELDTAEQLVAYLASDNDALVRRARSLVGTQLFTQSCDEQLFVCNRGEIRANTVMH